MLSLNVSDPVGQLTDELRNFHDIVKGIMPSPGEVPRLRGIDVYGGVMPLNGVVGGDHIIYVDFKQRYDLEARIKRAAEEGKKEVVENLKRCRRMAGIVLVDASGHQATDALLAAMLHQAFLLGALYELDMCGKITKRLFENLNTRFYKSSGVRKFLTMIYGEISEDATFKFLSAAHPPPVVFSNKHDRFMEVCRDLCTSFPPIGTLPSENVIDHRIVSSVLGYKSGYEVNEWKIMGEGDILLLYTDGLLEHHREGEAYFPGRLEQKIREVKRADARTIFETVQEDLHAFAAPTDDISLVVIKRS